MSERTEPDLAAVASMLADRTRASVCWALFDGRAWTATELAGHAGVAPSTITEHLNALVRGNLLAEERQGRHRYVRLASPQVAELIEDLAALAPSRPVVVHSLSAAGRQRALAYARTCYDHLAGVVGVGITQAMTDNGLLEWSGGLALTNQGSAWLEGLGVALPAKSRRPVVRPCLDWTERRPHVAGAVGAALCSHAFETGWIVRGRHPRAVKVTEAGRRVFGDLGVETR